MGCFGAQNAKVHFDWPFWREMGYIWPFHLHFCILNGKIGDLREFEMYFYILRLANGKVGVQKCRE